MGNIVLHTHFLDVPPDVQKAPMLCSLVSDPASLFPGCPPHCFSQERGWRFVFPDGCGPFIYPHLKHRVLWNYAPWRQTQGPYPNAIFY